MSTASAEHLQLVPSARIPQLSLSSFDTKPTVAASQHLKRPFSRLKHLKLVSNAILQGRNTTVTVVFAAAAYIALKHQHDQ